MSLNHMYVEMTGRKDFNLKLMCMLSLHVIDCILNVSLAFLVVSCLVTQRQLSTLEDNTDFVYYILLSGGTVVHVLTFSYSPKRGM